MASQTSDRDWGTRMLYILAIVAAVFFVVLMVFAIQNADDSTSGESPTPTTAPEPTPEPSGG
ncbi:MAG: hypothetical protein ACR2PK_03945 [Acidimicrobiales bacterium]